MFLSLLPFLFHFSAYKETKAELKTRQGNVFLYKEIFKKYIFEFGDANFANFLLASRCQ